MKKIFYILAAVLLSMTMNSCGEKWLNVQSHDSITIDEYYNTPDRIYQALVAAYDPLQWFDWNGSQYSPVPMVYEVMADDFYPGGADANDNRHFHLMHNFVAEPDIVVSSIWTVAYSGINRANCVHKYMPGVVGIDDSLKAEYLAEATVLRTWYYTQLWKLWGNIPYYEQNLDFPYICDQSKADDVYNGMVTALETVIDSEALPMKRTANSELGRVTQAAAMMLYAEIVMYQNDKTRFQKALDYMEEIITGGKYALNPKVEEMWEQVGEWSSESILEINFYSSGASRSWSNPIYAGGTVLPTLVSPESLEGSSKYGGNDGWGFFPMTEMAAAAFEEGDLRKAVTIYRPDSEGATYLARYQDTGNYIAKYLNRSQPLSTEGQIADANLNHNNNIRLYRYAETLLNAAELIAVHGCSGKGSADAYLNEVRTRAGLGNAQADKASILQERRVELMGEGKRYWDLIRLGEAANVLTPANDLGGYRTNSWTESKKYLPIPQSEIDSAQGTLTQNQY